MRVRLAVALPFAPPEALVWYNGAYDKAIGEGN
jgi:hypothetical protein